MTGSNKQINWANDIRNSKKEEFAKLEAMTKNNPAAAKAVDFVKNIDKAAFWIDNRNNDVMSMMDSLMHGTLQIWGNEHDRKAKLNPQTGEIVISWKEIVHDGKGGHTETRTQVI